MTETFDIFKPIPKDDAALIARLAPKTLSYLPNLELMYGISRRVTEGEANVRDYFVGDMNLGKEVTVIPTSLFRAHATHWEDGEKKAESYDADSPVYQQIEAKAKKFAKGFACGPEYLVWVPEAGEFAILPFKRSNLSAAQDFHVLIGGAVIVTSKVVKGKKNTYPVYDFRLADVDMSSLPAPTTEQVEEATKLFNSVTLKSKPAVAER